MCYKEIELQNETKKRKYENKNCHYFLKLYFHSQKKEYKNVSKFEFEIDCERCFQLVGDQSSCIVMCICRSVPLSVFSISVIVPCVNTKHSPRFVSFVDCDVCSVSYYLRIHRIHSRHKSSYH